MKMARVGTPANAGFLAVALLVSVPDASGAESDPPEVEGVVVTATGRTTESPIGAATRSGGERPSGAHVEGGDATSASVVPAKRMVSPGVRRCVPPRSRTKPGAR